ncbi:MAG: cyclic nucleotide-binding domain-containing protein [Nitriliruptoraceae bacterium]
MFKRRKTPSQRLQTIPLLEGCSQKELQTLAERSSLRTYDAGSVLVEQDSPSAEMFLIVDGSVVVTDEAEALATLGAGTVLGESAILDWWLPPKDRRSKYETGRRTATVTASSDAPVEAVVIEPAGFERLRDEAPGVARRLMEELRRRVRDDDTEPGTSSV